MRSLDPKLQSTSTPLIRPNPELQLWSRTLDEHETADKANQ